MSKAKKIWHKGHCHCGEVNFEVRTPIDVEITDCNCSMCAKTGYQHLIVDVNDFKILKGEKNQTSYRFGTYIANHLFCKCCGVKSFYVPRSHPDGISVNFRCVDQSGFKTIKFNPFDGQNWEDNIKNLRGA